MKIKIREFKVKFEKRDIDLETLIGQKYKIRKTDIKEIIISKESIDARDKNNICIVYNLILDINDSSYKVLKSNKNISIYADEEVELEYPRYDKLDNPIIVGFGPAGMFAALYLSRCGANPIIVERGSSIDDRILDVNKFLNNKELNPNSNIQFGEGGAGTFSDGKLTTSLNDKYIKFILKEFVSHGAPENILYESMPHIGTDYLRKVVKNIRLECIKNGAKFYFNTTFLNYSLNDDIIKCEFSNNMVLETKHLILGFGHSARDTIKMLYDNGAIMEPKSFSMGVRIEHKREDINFAQYGECAKYLKPAYYKLSCHLEEGRGVYTFCMCPGGEVMASTSENNTIVTNGMSYFKRDKVNSNSGFLVSVNVDDYFKSSPLDGMYYQEYYEKKAFEISKDYRAPANLVGEFLKDEIASSVRSVKPSYPHGIVFADLNNCLPDYVVKSLKEALPVFDRKLKGFANKDAILTGIETRSSSPIRMLRDENRMSNIKGIYPIGEGPGYAGGITSAALDGLKTAIFICK